jgi:hypothetical protein
LHGANVLLVQTGLAQLYAEVRAALFCKGRVQCIESVGDPRMDPASLAPGLGERGGVLGLAGSELTTERCEALTQRASRCRTR